MFCQSGFDIQEEYRKIGKVVDPAKGILHAKSFRMGRYLICGCTNWTFSSRCNQEMSVLCRMSNAGIADFERRVEDIAHNAIKMMPAKLKGGRRSRSSSRARSASPRTHMRKFMYDHPGEECGDSIFRILSRGISQEPCFQKYAIFQEILRNPEKS